MKMKRNNEKQDDQNQYYTGRQSNKSSGHHMSQSEYTTVDYGTPTIGIEERLSPNFINQDY